MANPPNGYQPDTKSESSRRADFELLRRLAFLERNGGGGGPGESFVIDPAYAGPRRDGAATVASFSNTALGGKNGVNVDATGKIQLNVSQGSPTKGVEAVSIGADGTTETWLGGFYTDKFQYKDIAIGVHPATGLNSLWLASRPAAADYMLAREGGNLLLNGYSGSQISFRLGNVDWGRINSNASVHEAAFNTRVVSSFATPNFEYYWANFVGTTSNAGSNARLSLLAVSTGAQLRADATTGQKIGVVTLNVGAFAPIAASAFEVGSSLAYKRDVRHLDRQQDRIVVRHDPMADTVPEVDIMDLRPVRFRPKVGEIKVEFDPEFPDDHTKGHYVPAEGIIGHEGSRERLGMVAEEVQHIVPSAVTHDSNGNCTGIDYAQITVALLDHVQRLTEEVATLRYRIAELEGAS